MIPKSGYRFSEKIMLHQKSMIPKSGSRFSEKIMLHPKEHDPEKWIPVFGKDHAPPKRA
jgi:hypothetical protein